MLRPDDDIRMIAGLERVTSGEIYLNGKPDSRTPPRHRDIAVVFQNYALYPHKTVAGNRSYALKLRKTPKAETEEERCDASPTCSALARCWIECRTNSPAVSGSTSPSAGRPSASRNSS